MKTTIKRELALLTLPVLFIGGGAWWLQTLNTGGALLTNPFGTGPLRVEYSPFERVDITPLEAWQGFDFAVKSSTVVKGTRKINDGWDLEYRKGQDNWAYPSNLKILYRVGKVWRQITEGPKSKPTIFSTEPAYNDNSKWRICVNLDSVPREAQEIRLKGNFYSLLHLKKPAQAPKKRDLYRFEEVLSPPFDVEIQGADKVRPKPVASQETPSVPMSVYYEVNSFDSAGYNQNIYIRFHRDPKFGPRSKAHRNHGFFTLQTYTIRDGQGRKLELVWGDAQNVSGEDQIFNQLAQRVDGDSQQSDFEGGHLPDTDFVVQVLGYDLVPKGGWYKYQGPFTLEAEVSDDETWPIKVKIPIRRPDLSGWKDYPVK